jgi:hypothetical protein
MLMPATMISANLGGAGLEPASRKYSPYDVEQTMEAAFKPHQPRSACRAAKAYDRRSPSRVRSPSRLLSDLQGRVTIAGNRAAIQHPQPQCHELAKPARGARVRLVEVDHRPRVVTGRATRIGQVIAKGVRVQPRSARPCRRFRRWVDTRIRRWRFRSAGLRFTQTGRVQ